MKNTADGRRETRLNGVLIGALLFLTVLLALSAAWRLAPFSQQVIYANSVFGS